MSIAASLERTIGKMQALWQRNNGDFDAMFPDLLDDARADIERVSGLENVGDVNGCDYSQIEGKSHVQHS